MKCSDIHSKVSLYTDDFLNMGARSAFEDHLTVCPLCRERVDEIQVLKANLRQFARPEIPSSVSNRIRLAVRNDIRSGRSMGFTSVTNEWIQMRLMPLGVGIMASFVIGLSFLTMLFSGSRAISEYAVKSNVPDTHIMLAANRNPFSADGSENITPADYARTRMSVAGESPSINPQGALIELSRSLVRSGMKNGEVVVVADVFSNGLAQIAEVVEPPRNVSAVVDLEKAFDADVANAPFVPASLDSRSDSVRVVLKFQSVEVNTRPNRKRH